MNLNAMTDVNFTSFFSEYGLDSGKKFVEKLNFLFETRNISADITLGELFAKTKKRLIITATSITNGICYFDHLSKPTLPVVLAIRMSFALPLIFTAVPYDNDIFVDGGVLDNCPVNAIMKIYPDVDPLSILVIRTSTNGEEKNIISSQIPFDRYITMLMSTIFREIETLRKNKVHYPVISISKKTRLYQHQNTLFSDEEKIQMFKIGYTTTKKYLQSPAWLIILINKLPYHLIQKIWRYVHYSTYQNCIKKLLEKVESKKKLLEKVE